MWGSRCGWRWRFRSLDHLIRPQAQGRRNGTAYPVELKVREAKELKPNATELHVLSRETSTAPI
jgi:hypothetical protein